MHLPSVMQSQHRFSEVPQARIERSSFDRSHGYKTTLNEGYLVPVFVDEVLPGDTFNLRMTAFCRLSTPLRPIMDNLYLDSFFFFVPNRLLWDNWKKFNGEQLNPGDSTSFVVPYSDSPAGGYLENSLQDYMGIPTKVAGLRHTTLHTRAYNLIYNEWFRDENLQNSVTVDKGDGPDTPANYVLLKRGKRHDYFTSCLPWPQKGTAVSLPLGSTAPVLGIYSSPVNTVAVGGNVPVGTAPVGVQSIAGSAVFAASKSAAGTAAGTAFNSTNADVYADLSLATAATVNSLRQAIQIQKMYERDARGGTRYTEIVRAHFGVVSPDARLQRPEYLGGGSTPINVHPVAATQINAASGVFPGFLGGFGTGVGRDDGFTKSFTEHGVIVGLVSIRADLNYQQGLNRMWSRSSRFDFFWPALAHLGEQAVLSKEIYADGTAGDSDVFGYQERYAEYRYKPSLVTGLFRSNAGAPLDLWHLSQQFSGRPTLNAAFIVESPPVSRIVAVVSEPHFYLDAYFRLNCVRPMPVYSVPGLMDHF